MINLIGIVAAIFTTLSFLPQAIQTIKTKNTEGISLAMYVIYVSGIALWIFYGILLKNPILIVSNSLTFILAGTVLAMKIKARWKY